jgi:hypothetical protein
MQQKADCFYITLQLVREDLLGKSTLKGILLSQFPDADLSKSKVFLTHGILESHSGKPIHHAWVEMEGYVLEFSAANQVVQPITDYYKEHQVKFAKRFSPQRAFDLLASGHVVGYWGDPKGVQTALPTPTFQEWLAIDFLELHRKDGHEIEMRKLFGP